MTSEQVSIEKKYPQKEALVIGGGVSGIYMLHKLRELGLDAKVVEAGSGPGGTWYWNRYPGARFDSESYTYNYSFSKEMLQEWSWSEHFAAQPETLQYLNYVVDKLNLREHMQFNSRVETARYCEDNNLWFVTLDGGETITSRFLFTAIGMLSAATMPRISGVNAFKGQSFHTYNWPKEKVELTGKRVAVIGTGATGVQVISEIADKVESLTVFQRRPNWCAPLHNSSITDEEQSKIKFSFNEIFEKMRTTAGSFIHGADRRETKNTSKEERYEFWEKLYAAPGFGIWHGNFYDTFLSEEANAELSEFIAGKIRERVKDPEVAAKLIPVDHGFGTRRVPLETRYYEAYNRDNVCLVDVAEDPIEEINTTGIKTASEQLDFDVIVYATGFDAITGAFDRFTIIGKDGLKLREKWFDGPVTHLGIQVNEFPNLFIIAGPQSASVAANFPPNIEFAVDWISKLVKHLKESGYNVVESSSEAEQSWVAEIMGLYEGVLLSKATSWFTGYNSNVDGHDKLRYMLYLGGSPAYRDRLENIAKNGYPGFVFE